MFSYTEGSSLSCFEPLVVLREMTTPSTTFPYPPDGSSFSSGVISVTSPSQTSFVSLILIPIALQKFSISTSVFFTSLENTSEPIIGQNGTCGPNSYAMARAIAVLPVPGAPAKSRAFPAIFLLLIISTTIPAASRAFYYPQSPCEISFAEKSSLRPSPLI